MKKWIILIVVLAAVAVAVWYFYFRKEKPVGDETPKDEKDSNANNTNKGSSQQSTTNTGSNANAVQYDVPIKSANSATVLQLQKDLNKVFDNWRMMNVLPPLRLKEDGKWGAKTNAAVKFVYASKETFFKGKTVLPEQLTENVGNFNINQIALAMKYCTMQIELAHSNAQPAKTIVFNQTYKWALQHG